MSLCMYAECCTACYCVYMHIIIRSAAYLLLYTQPLPLSLPPALPPPFPPSLPLSLPPSSSSPTHSPQLQAADKLLAVRLAGHTQLRQTCQSSNLNSLLCIYILFDNLPLSPLSPIPPSLPSPSPSSLSPSLLLPPLSSPLSPRFRAWSKATCSTCQATQSSQSSSTSH